MGVRVRVRIHSKGGIFIDANALLNTGFESEEPEVMLPIRVAEGLELWPKLPEGAIIKTFETAGGMVRMPVIEGVIEVVVITDDGTTEPVKCSAVISELESEVLLNDRAIEELGIVIENPGKGIWRFRGEEKLRGSEEPQYW